MLYRGRITANLLNKRQTTITPTVSAYSYEWNPSADGSRLIVDFTNYTSSSAAGSVTITLAAAYISKEGEELEIVYRNCERKPVTVNLSSFTSSNPTGAEAQPNADIGEQLLVLRRASSTDWHVVDAYAASNASTWVQDLAALSNYEPVAVSARHGESAVNLRCAHQADGYSSFCILGGQTYDSTTGNVDWAIYYGDGRGRWSKATLPVTPLRYIQCLYMYSDAVGYAGAGVSGAGSVTELILKTTDGGVTWSDIALPSAISSVSGIESTYYASATHYVAYQRGYNDRIFVSDDGGTTWLQESLGGSFIVNSISKSSSGVFTAAGYEGTNGRVWKRNTAAAGSGTWTLAVSIAAANTQLYSISENMAVGAEGKVLWSADSWATYYTRPQLQFYGTPVDIYKVCRVRNYYAVGFNWLDGYTRGLVAVTPNTGLSFYGQKASAGRMFGTGMSSLTTVDKGCRLAVRGESGEDFGLSLSGRIGNRYTVGVIE